VVPQIEQNLFHRVEQCGWDYGLTTLIFILLLEYAYQQVERLVERYGWAIDINLVNHI
jgi:hypothetical protein